MALAAYTPRLCKFNRFNKNGLFGRDTNSGSALRNADPSRRSRLNRKIAGVHPKKVVGHAALRSVLRSQKS